jgi:hypothetical protein
MHQKELEIRNRVACDLNVYTYKNTSIRYCCPHSTAIICLQNSINSSNQHFSQSLSLDGLPTVGCKPNKKRNTLIKCRIFRCSGAGESRTPVQTYSTKAFYMLILALIVGKKPEPNKPISSLAGWSVNYSHSLL